MKEQLQKLYAKYSFYILRVMQFALGVCVFGSINSNIGFIEAVSSKLCTVGFALVFAFLPLNSMVLAAAVLILAQLFTFSLPVGVISLAIFLVMYIFYIRFTPKKAWLIAVTVIGLTFKIPFVVPVAFGLLGTSSLMVPAILGTMVYYMLHSVKVSASALQSGGEQALMDGIMVFTKQVLVHKEMWMMAVMMAIVVLLVYGIRTRAINHAWKTATVVGVITAALLNIIGGIVLDISFPTGMIVVDVLVAVLTGLLLELFFFSVDYSRAENLQFEDDEYYYYVKAIPKVGVTVPNKQVKHITEPQEENQKETRFKMEELRKNPTTKADGYQQPRRNLEKPSIHETMAIHAEQITEENLEKSVNELLLTKSLNEELGLNQQVNNDGMGITRSLEEIWEKNIKSKS